MNSPSNRYSAVAIVLHWTIAALILTNLYLGLTFDGKHGMALFRALQLHKSLGLTVLLLSLVRLTWRLTHKAPPLPGHMPAWEKFGAQAAHWGLYALMVAIPLTGWAIVSASPTNIPTLLYNKVPWPHLGFIHDMAMPARKALEEQFGETHELLAFATIGLLVLHIGAALKHQFFDKDEVLSHMLPFVRPKTRSEIS